MNKVTVLIHLLISLGYLTNSYSQSPATDEKLSVEQRMAKARAAKSEKKINKSTGKPQFQKATPEDYKTPVDKVRKGPNGEVVRTGERGAKFYINKNGNKTYLSSNQ